MHLFLVHRSLLLEKSGRRIYSKQSKASDKALCTEQALRTSKATCPASGKTSRATGNLESRQEDYAMGN